MIEGENGKMSTVNCRKTIVEKQIVDLEKRRHTKMSTMQNVEKAKCRWTNGRLTKNVEK